jgi:glutathione S-transferase
MANELVLWVDSEFTSPWAHSCWVTLQEKGLDVTLETIDIERGAHREGEYPTKVLTGKIPSLRHGDLWLAESSAICEYLEEVFPPPGHAALLSREPVARARDREMMSWLRSDLFELRRCMPYEGIFVSKERPAMTSKASAEIAKVVKAAESRWNDGAPEAPTLADFELAIMMMRPIHYGSEVPTTLRDVVDALWARPSMRSWTEMPR